MTGPVPDLRLSLVERDLLRLLCRDGNAGLVFRLAGRELIRYSWQQLDHQIVFEALIRVSSRRHGTFTREQLAAEITRMGFPDIDVREFFSPVLREQTSTSKRESEQSVSALIQQLTAARD